MLSESLAPGSRVRIRDEEWMVEKCLPLSTGGYAVHVRGLSELVLSRPAIFLDTLDDVRPLRPEDTKLVEDTSPEYRQTRLYLETLLRRTPPTDWKIHVGHRGAIQVMDYQLVPARRALGEPTEGGMQCIRPRILIADGTGLGKTIEAGIILSELIKRGKGRRILVICVKSLLAQFQRDLWARFTIPLVRLDSDGIRRVQSKIPSNKNPFSYYDRCIISVDTLKNNGKYRAELEQIRWDAIVVDECQNVANRGSQRETLARLLASQTDALILTSATPHNGRAESFANLMRMLDPTAIADEKHFTRDDIEHLFVRRFKKDVEAQAKGAFQNREVVSHASQASPAEAAALNALRVADLHNLGRQRSHVDKLFTWTLIKAFLSSPHACLESIDNRIRTTKKTLQADEHGPHPHAAVLQRDLEKLAELKSLVEAALSPNQFTKLEALFAELKALGIDGTKDSPRVVIFSERIRTLEMLREELTKRLNIKNPDQAIGTFEASLPDTELRELKESFGREGSPLRILLASDAASEGINLHYHCSQLFHFDIPWSLIRLTQRNGRIDRFGQKKTPFLHYLLTKTSDESADQQVVDRLIEREKVVYKQLGDAGALLGLYDADAEDEFITRGIASGQSAVEVIPDAPRPPPAEEDLDDDGAAAASLVTSSTDAASSSSTRSVTDGEIDLFALLDGDDTTPGASPSPARASTATPSASTPDAPATDINKLLEAIAPPRVRSTLEATAGLPSLFAGDFDLTVNALRQLEKHPLAGPEGLTWDKDDENQAVRITPPGSFLDFRAEFLPDESLPEKNQAFKLVAKHDVVQEKIRDALESDDGAWPEWQLLWEQHPLMEWLLDTLAAAFARHEAPLLLLPKLGEKSYFLVSTLVSNEEAQPVHTAWFAVEASGNRLTGVTLDLEKLLELTGIQGGLTNPHKSSTQIEMLSTLVPQAISAAHEQVKIAREPLIDGNRKKARAELRRLVEWEKKAEAAIERDEARYRRGKSTLAAPLAKKINQRRHDIARFKRNHEVWLKSLEGKGGTYVRLAAVFTGK